MKRALFPILLLLLSGCLAQQGPLQSIYGDLPQPAKVCLSEAGNSDPRFFSCIVKLSQSSGNSTLCEDVFSGNSGYNMVEKRDTCIFAVESQHYDSGFCSRLGQGGFRSYCSALMELSPEKCTLLEHDSGTCYLQTEFLELGESQGTMAFACRSLTKSNCLREVATESEDPGVCAMVKEVCNVNYDHDCRADFDECYMRVAEKTGDSSLCSKLAEPFNNRDWGSYSPEKAMNECALQVFNSKSRLSECSKLSGRHKGECILKYAVATGDPTQCSKIGEELRGTVAFPVRHEDYSAPHSEWSVYAISRSHDECLTNLAVNLKNASICEAEFLVDNGADLCFFELALTLEDSEICGRIASQDFKDTCESQT